MIHAADIRDTSRRSEKTLAAIHEVERLRRDNQTLRAALEQIANLKRLLVIFVLLALLIPSTASAISQHGYVRGSDGIKPIVQAKVFIRNNATGAVGSTATQYPYGDWHFYNITDGRSYTYWSTYQPLICVHPASVLRYYTAQFTKTAYDNSYGALGIWNVGHINLERATWITC